MPGKNKTTVVVTTPEPAPNTRKCVTGTAFLSTVNGVSNIIILILILATLICVGVISGDDAQAADKVSFASTVKLSVAGTRNAIIAFSIIAMILLLFDTIMYSTSCINHFPEVLDSIFIYVMFVIGGIYLILACCAAALEQKMKDTLGRQDKLTRQGACAAAAAFLFINTGLIITAFVLRLVHPVQSPPP